MALEEVIDQSKVSNFFIRWESGPCHLSKEKGFQNVFFLISSVMCVDSVTAF